MFFSVSVHRFTPLQSSTLTQNTSKTILREFYEGLREYCEAIGYLKGYKFLDHGSIGFFLRDILKEQSLFKKFDRYRKLRNGINYYGNDIDLETVKEAASEIPVLVKGLEKYSKWLIIFGYFEQHKNLWDREMENKKRKNEKPL